MIKDKIIAGWEAMDRSVANSTIEEPNAGFKPSKRRKSTPT